MNVKNYARRHANGEIKAKEEKRRVSPVEKYAAAHVNIDIRALARKNETDPKPERPKREERNKWQTESTEN